MSACLRVNLVPAEGLGRVFHAGTARIGPSDRTGCAGWSRHQGWLLPHGKDELEDMVPAEGIEPPDPRITNLVADMCSILNQLLTALALC